MTMTFDTPTLYAEHVPDFTTEDAGDGTKFSQELPGHVYFGIVVQGVKVPLGRKATAGLLADIERAKEVAAKQEAAQPDTTSQPSG